MLGKHVLRRRGPERQGAGSCLAPAGLTPWASGGLPGHGTVRVAAAGPSPSEGPLCPSREGLPPPHPSCDGAPPPRSGRGQLRGGASTPAGRNETSVLASFLCRSPWAVIPDFRCAHAGGALAPLKLFVSLSGSFAGKRAICVAFRVAVGLSLNLRPGLRRGPG